MHPMTRRSNRRLMSKIAIFAVAAAASLPGVAFAHAHLAHTVPAAGSTIPAGLADLELDFTEPVEPKFSTVEILDPDGKPRSGIAVSAVPDNGTRLTVHLDPALPPGVYRVKWHALSVDTHQTDGSYMLTVAAISTDLRLGAAWARATPAKSDIGAAYLSLESHAGDRLLSVASTVADKAELHEHTMENGIMKMRQVAAIDLPADKSIEFKPGGYHIMLSGLHQPLVAGTHFPLTLTFEKAGSVTVDVEVGPPGAAGPGPEEHHHGG